MLLTGGISAAGGSGGLSGGVGALGGLGGLTGIFSGSGKPLSQNTINLVMDGQVIDRRVITNFGNYQSIARDRRLTQ
jgi:hypothetical protein